MGNYLKVNTYLSFNVECVLSAFKITKKNDNDISLLISFIIIPRNRKNIIYIQEKCRYILTIVILHLFRYICFGNVGTVNLMMINYSYI